MHCNIDAKGKAVRLVIGAIVLAAGVAFLGRWWIGGASWTLIVGICACAGALFAIFEGAAGWCALRALGVRTPL